MYPFERNSCLASLDLMLGNFLSSILASIDFNDSMILLFSCKYFCREIISQLGLHSSEPNKEEELSSSLQEIFCIHQVYLPFSVSVLAGVQLS